VVKLVALLCFAACSSSPYLDSGFDAERAPDLDAAFHQDPRWLGGDGAYTIDLGDDRTLWLFGDSFISTSIARVRTESTMVRNSVAVMTGRDLATATMAFAWRDGAPPTSFFPEDGDHWFWPSDGVRLPGGPLVMFLSEVQPTPDVGLGFAGAGFRAVMVADPSGPADAWTLAPTSAHAPAFAPDANVACSTTVDGYLVALVTDGDAHHGRLARWPLDHVATGELANPEWWRGDTWVSELFLTQPPAIVIDNGATECSIQPETYGGFTYVATRGFGATTIAVRHAYPDLTSSWTEPQDAFAPPESAAVNAFVYAAKGHPMIDAGYATLVVTYADNSFAFGDLLDPTRAQTLYWPHVALFRYLMSAS
jgi:hypothetical protein